MTTPADFSAYTDEQLQAAEAERLRRSEGTQRAWLEEHRLKLRREAREALIIQLRDRYGLGEEDLFGIYYAIDEFTERWNR